MVMSHLAALTLKYSLKIVLPARPWLLPTLMCFHADCYHLWNCFCFYTNSIASLKRLSGQITPKTNLTLSPEFDGCAEEPGAKASWLVEDWASKAGLYLEHVPHNQHFQLDQQPIQYSIVCRFRTSAERKSLPLLDIWELSVVSRVCQFVVSVKMLKTRVINNLHSVCTLQEPCNICTPTQCSLPSMGVSQAHPSREAARMATICNSLFCTIVSVLWISYFALFSPTIVCKGSYLPMGVGVPALVSQMFTVF